MAFVRTCALTACADPGIFVKGGPGPMARKQHGQRFFSVFFLVLNLFYSLQEGSNGFITEKTILFQGSAHEQRSSKNDRNRSLNMRTDKHAYAEF